MTATTSTAKGTVAEWTIREQLILASAVQRSGDQNWVSVSRAVKPLVDDVRPADYFSQKNCALQYSAMLDKAGTPKRKRTSEGAPEIVETAEQQIVRQLTEKRINELNVSLKQTKEEYLSLKKEIEQIEKGGLEEKIPELWEQMNAEIAAKEALEKKRESSSGSVKLKSPPGKSSPSSNLAKYHAQLKQRKMKSPPPLPIMIEQSPSTAPQPVPMELCSPTSPSPIITPPLKGEKLAPPKTFDQPDGEKMVVGRPLPSKSAHAGIVPPLKLPLNSGVASTSMKDVPSGSPGATTTTSSPMTKSLPIVTTPKEETLCGVPMQAPHPSTEGNLQLSSNMHIIVQQPNKAVLDSAGEKMPVPESSYVQQPISKPSEVQPPPSKANVESVDNKMPSPKELSPSVSIPSLTATTGFPLKTALAPTLVTTTPAVAAPSSSTIAPQTINTTAAMTSPVLLNTPTVKQDATPTAASVHVALPAMTKDGTSTTNVTTPTMAPSTLAPVNVPTIAPIITTMPAQLATPTTNQITTPTTVGAAIHRAAEPVTSFYASVPMLPTNIVPTASIPATVQPSPPAGPPTTVATVAPSPPLAVESTTAVMSQRSPQTVELPPSATIQELPSTLSVAAEPSAKVTDLIVATTRASITFVKPSASVQPSSKPTESSVKDTPMEIDETPSKHIQPSTVAPPSSTAIQTPAVEVQSSNNAEVAPPTPKVAPPTTNYKAAPKFIQTTLKLTPGSPKVTQPAAKVSPTALAVSKVTESPDEVTKPTQKADKAPETPSQVEKEAPSAIQPSSAKTEPVSITPVVTSTQPSIPPIISSTAAAPLASKSKTPTKLKPVASTMGGLGTPSPLLSTHTPTPSPLVTTAMKAPLVSSAVKTIEEKAVSEAPMIAIDGDEVKPKAKQEGKTVTKKRERERRRSASEEQTPVKSPTRKVKSSPEKMDVQEPSESKRSRKASTPKRSPSTSPASANTRTTGATIKSPKSPPAAKKGRDSDTTPKTPPKDTAKEKSEEKREEEKATEEMATSPATKTKTKEPVVKAEGTPSVSQPLQEKEKQPAMVTVSVVAADSPSTAAVPSGQKEGEQEEGEREGTPVKVARTTRKTPQRRSRKRKAEDDGPSVESTDTEEEIPSSAQTSAVPSPSPSLTGETDIETIQARKQWKKAIMLVWRHAAQHKYANLFLHPVREEDAPGYRDVILRPMDLSTIKRKIESGQIRTDMEFQRDMLLMFQNAFMYNSSDHDVFFMAESMKTDVMENIQAYLATQAQLQLMGEEPLPQKTLRSRESRRTAERDLYEESLFSPAKKRRLKGDD